MRHVDPDSRPDSDGIGDDRTHVARYFDTHISPADDLAAYGRAVSRDFVAGFDAARGGYPNRRARRLAERHRNDRGADRWLDGRGQPDS